MSSNPSENYPKTGEVSDTAQPQPGSERDMKTKPDSDLSNYRPADKLKGKAALITGGDSGIGRAVAVAFAMEGADVAIMYNESDADAEDTCEMVTKHGARCLSIKADVRMPDACRAAVERTVQEFGDLNILVNNAAYQQGHERFEDATLEELRRTFDTNILGYFHMAHFTLPHLKEGDTIINTGSSTGIYGNSQSIAYSSTKGAIHTFTKSLAVNLAERGIRVNCVIPGPIWTPAIPASGDPEKTKQHGSQAALGRPGQPEEVAPAYVYFAATDSSFTTGALLEIHGGFTKLG